MDSDILAHFLQVESQIAKSRWCKAKLSMTTQGDKLLDSSFPDFEDFVYAAMYFRQFILPKDDLLNDAVRRYFSFLDCGMRRVWVQAEQQRFTSTLNGKTLMLPKYTAREVFDAFAYGAGLIHRAPELNNRNRARFLQLYDHEPRENVLFELNMSLHHLLNHASRVAAVIHQDFAEWLDVHGLPRPDVRWHDRLFTLPKKGVAAPPPRSHVNG
jgi:hypothetical protein